MRLRQHEQERKGLKPTATVENVEKGADSYYILTLADDRALVFEMTPNRLYVTDLSVVACVTTVAGNMRNMALTKREQENVGKVQGLLHRLQIPIQDLIDNLNAGLYPPEVVEGITARDVKIFRSI